MTKYSVAVFKGEALVQLLTLTGQDVRIGRSPDNEMCLKDDGKAVSRFHAELRPDKNGYAVIDLNSQNGTWVDGQRVTRTPMTDGHDIVIGPYRLMVREGDFAEGELPAMAVPSGSQTLKLQSGSHAIAPTLPMAPRKSSKSGVRRAEPQPRPKATDPVAWVTSHPPVMYGGLVAIVAVAVVVVLFVPGAPNGSPAEEPSSAAPAATPAPTVTPDPAAPAPVVTTPVSAPVTPVPPPPVIEPPPVTAASSPTAAPPGQAPTRRPTKKVDQPVDPNALARLDGESDADYQARNSQASSAYQRAVDRLSQRDWADAVKELSALADRFPGYRDTAAKLDEARAGMREAAQSAFESGKSLLPTDMPAAVQQLDRAAQLGVTEAAELATRTRERMRSEGLAEFKRAKQYDAANRVPEAIAFYERAVRYLPAGDSDRQFAEERLKRLRQ